jgi:hypothetical protein
MLDRIKTKLLSSLFEPILDYLCMKAFRQYMSRLHFLNKNYNLLIICANKMCGPNMF